MIFILTYFQKPKNSITADLLLAEVRAAIIRSPKRQVVVRGDKNINYDCIVQVMTVLQRAGVASVGLETSEVDIS